MVRKLTLALSRCPAPCNFSEVMTVFPSTAPGSVVVPLNTHGFINMADSISDNCAIGRMHIQARRGFTMRRMQLVMRRYSKA